MRSIKEARVDDDEKQSGGRLIELIESRAQGICLSIGHGLAVLQIPHELLNRSTCPGTSIFVLRKGVVEDKEWRVISRHCEKCGYGPELPLIQKEIQSLFEPNVTPDGHEGDKPTLQT